jgi:hypothetical protein
MKRIGMTLLTAVVLLMSCGTTAPAATNGDNPKPQETGAPDIFIGYGQDPSFLAAINEAKMDAVKKYIVSLMGENQASFYEEKLRVAIYFTSNPNQYVFENSLENLRKDKVGDDYIYELKIRVDEESIKNSLRAQDIPFPGSGLAEVDDTRREADSDPNNPLPPENTNVDIQEGDYEEATAEEARFIRRYVDQMTYMVYYNEAGDLTPEMIRAGIGRANRYFTENTMNVVDFEQIEKVKEDQRVIFEEETGNDVPFIQWLAQELNADIYLELDFNVDSESTNSRRHFASVAGTVKLFEPSTGFLLGSVPITSKRTMSPTSVDAAEKNAIEGALWEVMPKAISQSKAYMEKTLERGIRYEMIIQNTYDSRLMSQFRRRMNSKVKDIQVVSSTADETKYEVYMLGSLSDLEDTVYDVSENIGGLESMYSVSLRGKSITFNTGL